MQLAVRTEGHVDVAGFCRSVDLNRSVDLVEFGLSFRVNLAVFRTKASEDVQRFVAISRLEKPARRFCNLCGIVSDEIRSGTRRNAYQA